MPIAQINDHDMYYEIHGEGEPAICMGGWGTFCHGGERHLARGLTDRYQTLIIDYRGIGESTDDIVGILYARDLLDHVHLKTEMPTALREIVREPFYVPETMGIGSAFWATP